MTTPDPGRPVVPDALWHAATLVERTRLGEPVDGLAQRPSAPAWARTLAATVLAEEATADDPGSGLPAAAPDTPFACAAAPLLADARARLRRRLRALARQAGEPAFDPEHLTEQLFRPLPGIANQMLVRTALLELNLARVRGELSGADPAQRFASFVASWSGQAGRHALFTAYPVLGRQLAVATECWLDASTRFARHLAADAAKISAVFADGRRLGPVSQVRTGLGDRHRGGATVTRVSWPDGLTLMYKPRPATVDAHFQRLLGWVNEHGVSHPLRLLTCLPSTDHGWMEFVSDQACADEGARHRFYYRQGELLALLYLLNATDVHAENLIAAGEHPVLVDLESLVQPGTTADPSMLAAEVAAAHAVRSSVLATGLLPEHGWVSEAGDAVDLSGLGFTVGQRFPLAVPMIADAGTDLARIVLGRPVMDAKANRPVREDAPLRLLDYADDILAGFTEAYQLCAARKQDLLAGPLGEFAADEVRVVLRPTLWYATVLQTAFHPSVLRDAMDRERHFDALWQDVPQQPDLAGCVPHERADLWRNDIPVFTAGTDRPVLRSSSRRVVRKVRLIPGMTQVTSRLDGLGDADLARQLWLITAALGSSVVNVASDVTGPRYARPTVTGPARRDDLVAAADAIGWQLGTLAFQDDDSAQWIGVTSYGDAKSSLGVLQPDLYHGLAGVALFLGWLGQLTADARHTRLARRAVRTALLQLDGGALSGLSGLSGLGGVVFALAELGRLWHDDSLLDVAEYYAGRVAARAEQDVQFDFVIGSAGDIAALVALHQVRPSDQLAGQVRALADRLLATATPAPAGIGWLPAAFDDQGTATQPITGFAHGMAGIAAPLLQAWEILGDQRYRSAASEAVAFEQACYDPGKGLWRELRNGPDMLNAEEYPASGYWCHGGPGIGLGRLMCLSGLGDGGSASGELARAEIGAALSMVTAQSPGSHCLCHGDLGNLELYLQAADILGQPRWLRAAGLRAAEILASIKRDGWLCGTLLGVQVPGLMTGLAGIGLGLLRVADPAQVPSVLILRTAAAPAPR